MAPNPELLALTDFGLTYAMRDTFFQGFPWTLQKHCPKLSFLHIDSEQQHTFENLHQLTSLEMLILFWKHLILEDNWDSLFTARDRLPPNITSLPASRASNEQVQGRLTLCRTRNRTAHNSEGKASDRNLPCRSVYHKLCKDHCWSDIPFRMKQGVRDDYRFRGPNYLCKGGTEFVFAFLQGQILRQTRACRNVNFTRCFGDEYLASHLLEMVVVYDPATEGTRLEQSTKTCALSSV